MLANLPCCSPKKYEVKIQKAIVFNYYAVQAPKHFSNLHSYIPKISNCHHSFIFSLSLSTLLGFLKQTFNISPWIYSTSISTPKGNCQNINLIKSFPASKSFNGFLLSLVEKFKLLTMVYMVLWLDLFTMSLATLLTLYTSCTKLVSRVPWILTTRPSDLLFSLYETICHT